MGDLQSAQGIHHPYRNIPYDHVPTRLGRSRSPPANQGQTQASLSSSSVHATSEGPEPLQPPFEVDQEARRYPTAPFPTHDDSRPNPSQPQPELRPPIRPWSSPPSDHRPTRGDTVNYWSGIQDLCSVLVTLNNGRRPPERESQHAMPSEFSRSWSEHNHATEYFHPDLPPRASSRPRDSSPLLPAHSSAPVHAPRSPSSTNPYPLQTSSATPHPVSHQAEAEHMRRPQGTDRVLFPTNSSRQPARAPPPLTRSYSRPPPYSTPNGTQIRSPHPRAVSSPTTRSTAFSDLAAKGKKSRPQEQSTPTPVDRVSYPDCPPSSYHGNIPATYARSPSRVDQTQTRSWSAGPSYSQNTGANKYGGPHPEQNHARSQLRECYPLTPASSTSAYRTILQRPQTSKRPIDIPSPPASLSRPLLSRSTTINSVTSQSSTSQHVASPFAGPGPMPRIVSTPPPRGIVSPSSRVMYPAILEAMHTLISVLFHFRCLGSSSSSPKFNAFACFLL